jgi:hypothetical protein
MRVKSVGCVPFSGRDAFFIKKNMLVVKGSSSIVPENFTAPPVHTRDLFIEPENQADTGEMKTRLMIRMQIMIHADGFVISLLTIHHSPCIINRNRGIP